MLTTFKRYRIAVQCLAAWLLFTSCSAAWALIQVTDSRGHTLRLDRPAKRVISLVPHATEMLYAIGAGPKMVGVSDYSIYPPAAKSLPKVGGITGFSLEAVIKLKPDLVVVWADGASPRSVERLRQLNIPVYVSHPVKLEHIATEMEVLGTLTGLYPRAHQVATHFRQQLLAIQQRYSRQKRVKTFYQIQTQPMFTISNNSFLGSMISICGGTNVFGELKLAAPQISVNAVIKAQPDIILSTNPKTLSIWANWPVIPAVTKRALFVLPEQETTLPGPRILTGLRTMCEAIDTVRLTLYMH